MDPLTSTLLGFPLSILANVTYDQIKSIKERFSDSINLEDIYLKSFYKSIDQHREHYDEIGSNIASKLKKEVKKDERKFLNLLSENGIISYSSFAKEEYIAKISNNLIELYNFTSNYPIFVKQVFIDCFSFYVSSFFNLITEKDGIKAILIECLNLTKITDLLKQIDQKLICKSEFDELRKIVFDSYAKDNHKFHKSLNDYDAYLNNKFRYLELRGFSPKISGKEVQMELDDIFVPLTINQQNKFIPNILDELDLDNSTNTYKSIEILNNRELVILGDPGSGKSTLLKYLLTQVTTLRNKDHVLKNIIPVLFRLSDYSDFYKKHRKSIYEFIVNHIDNQYEHIFKENFEYSNLLILMDGLDEITETSLRLKVTEQVMDLIARYPNCRYIVTSRIVGYQEAKLGTSFSHCKLLPFREEEIEIFAKQWYWSIACHTDNDYEHALTLSDTLFNSIKRNPSVLKLATNPLLMTIIAMIHYQGKKLPSKRIELYEISTDTFLEHWVHLRITEESQLKDKSEILEILAPIAFEIHESKSNALIEENEFKDIFLRVFQEIHTNSTDKDAKITCDEFIKFIRQQTGFIYEKGIDNEGNRFYGFMHLTFEEYLASIEFVSLWSENVLKLEDYVFQSRWSEIIRLSASQIRLSFKGKAGRTQTSKFIEDILNVKDDFPDAFRPLQLVCLIIADDIGINDSIFNEVLDKLFFILSKFSFNSLINSISDLFKELLLSEKQKFIIDSLKKSLDTNNNLLYENLIKVLLNNYENIEIEKILKEQIKIGDKRLKIIGLLSYNDPLLTDKFLEPYFLKFLDSIETNDISEKELRLIRNYFLSNAHIQYFTRFNKKKSNQIKVILRKYVNNKHYTTILGIFLDIILVNISEITINLIKEIYGFSPNYSLINLLDSLNAQKDIILKNQNYSSSSFIRLGNHKGVLRSIDKILYLNLWDTKFQNFYSFNFAKLDYLSFLKNIENILSKDEIILLESDIHFINGPQGKDDDIERFINSMELGNLKIYDFFGWEYFPLLEINKEPLKLSEIILKHPSRYLDDNSSRKGKYAKKTNSYEVDNKDILVPIKLIIKQRAKQTYTKELINETIEFYNNCDEAMQEGVFEILYRVLNPINTTDNII